ncbi:MurR/RpiR family transcriptional regulator [Alicyclobacillus fastidiosus]|uniref:MurR/RpiR family transcriptional regulator n=1 Tax=Alicyclobacillus fastidiosus TaxID=392011 RepID=A0ABV5AAM9_9BACL|nr:MurR/RpiR family transcriptional regulator [Alicyclobacillus fastidiosus]WEH11912.1 MurR/RpiR family transcriptional regulator [Alicyclobacillus fastidiosus]
MNSRSITSRLDEWVRSGKGGSEVNRTISAYIEEHFSKVAFMTSAELAEQVGVSQASITRFAHSLGFSGFGEWSKEMQRMIRTELSAPERLWFASNPTLSTEEETGDRVVLSEHLHLQSLSDIIASAEFEALVRAIVDAKRVIFVGARASATLIPYLHYFLSKVRREVYAAVPSDTLWGRLLVEDPAGTLIIALAFPRYSRATVELVRELENQGFSIAAVTDHPDSPIAAHATPVVCVPVTTVSLFDSYATPITLFNLLIRRVAQLTPEVSKERLAEIEYLDQKHRVYD